MATTALRKLDQPIYRYWHAIYLAFFSPEFYVDVGKRWKGFGILYLLFLITLISIPFGILTTTQVKNTFYNQFIIPLEEAPPIYIKNGHAFLNEPMPYQVRNKDGEVILIIDTTGATQVINTQANAKYPNLFMLITNNKIVFRVPAKLKLTAPQSASLDTVHEEYFNQGLNEVIMLKYWLQSSGIYKAIYFLLALVYPGIVFSFFGLYLVLFLAFALMGQFISKLYFNRPLTYKESSRLLMVSSTPYLFFTMIMLYFNLFFTGSKIFLLLILFAYFCFAVHSLRKDSNKLVL